MAIITRGELVAAEDKKTLMKKLGRKRLKLTLSDPMTDIPAELAEWNVTLKNEGHELEYVFDSNLEKTGVPSLLRKLSDLGVAFKDLNTSQSSLEDIFVSLVHRDKTDAGTGAAA